MSVFVVSVEYCGDGKEHMRPSVHVFSTKENAAAAIYQYIKADEDLSDELPDEAVYDQNGDIDEEATNQNLLQMCFEIIETGGHQLSENIRIRVQKLSMNPQALMKPEDDWQLPTLIPFSGTGNGNKTQIPQNNKGCIKLVVS